MTWPTSLPLIAILRGIRPEEALPHAQALIDAGFDAIEVPLNSPQWQKSVADIVQRFGSRALIGGGTVLKPADVDALVEAGAKLVVTPNTRPSLIAYAVQRGLQVAAGFATASEAFDALDAGAQAARAPVDGDHLVGVSVMRCAPVERPVFFSRGRLAVRQRRRAPSRWCATRPVPACRGRCRARRRCSLPPGSRPGWPA